MEQASTQGRCAAIGGNNNGCCGTIRIQGGSIAATTNNGSQATAIGNGRLAYVAGTMVIEITGGEISAISSVGSGIGGN